MTTVIPIVFGNKIYSMNSQSLNLSNWVGDLGVIVFALKKSYNVIGIYSL